MTDFIRHCTPRRAFLVGASATGLVALSGCSTLGGFGFVDAIRRVLTLSSERAFARMIGDGGYWDNAVGQLGLGNALGTRGDVLSNILTSTLFKDRLESAFADIAEEGAARAAPLVADTVRTIGIENAVALVRGGPTAATQFLRGNMGRTLVETMVPEVGSAMRLAQEPLVGRLLTSVTGIDVGGIAQNLSTSVDNAIWQEIGIEESAIRADPGSTNDPLIMGVFGAGGLL